MSNLPPERPWTEEERYTLFTEILKKARVPSSQLVKMIRDFNISPSWADIPLPPGRSLNSCQMAFQSMPQHQPQHSVNPGLLPFPPPRHESSAPPVISSESGSSRKRPLFPSDKPIHVPRAIQPRPATSTASYSSESSASALLSPGLETVVPRGEPPRKRGRPSKAESERRKAAAAARGETYPAPRRSGSHKLKVPSAPTSPGIGSSGAPFVPQASGRPADVPKPEMNYAPPPARMMPILASSEEERTRVPNRGIGPTMRELPRPTEVRQTLPSPQTLQLGHRDAIARIDAGERPFEPLSLDRAPFTDSSRRSFLNPASRRPDNPTTSAPEVPMGAPTDKRSST